MLNLQYARPGRAKRAKKCEGYVVPNVWRFLFDYMYFVERPSLQVLSISSAFSLARSMKASPVTITRKMAKLFAFFFTDQLNVDVLCFG